MNIAELQARQGKVELTGKVTAKEEPRSFNRGGTEGQVCNATLQDDSGSIKLTLWNEQVGQVNVGDTIKISNGYVGEWQGELQLSTGKFGQLEVVGAESAPEAAAEPASEPEKPASEPAPEAENPASEPSLDEEEIE